MLVSFTYNGDIHSVVVDLDELLLKSYKQGDTCTLLVDKDNPGRVYKNALIWEKYGNTWLWAGLFLLVVSMVTN